MKRLVAICAIVGFVWAASAAVMADDLFPPDWRYGARTVYAHWMFSKDFGDQYWFPEYRFPEDWPDEYIYIEFPAGVPEWLDAYEGRSGVINVPSEVEFQIRNFEDPDRWKQIYLQLTWHTDGGYPDAFEVIPWPEGDVEVNQMEDFELENGWHFTRWGITIDPNPDRETIILWNSNGRSMYFDQIVFDSICIPEPGLVSLAGLLLGASALWLSRK